MWLCDAMKFHDQPDKEYHAAPGLSSSLLKLLLRSPAHYKAREHKDTAALRFGIAFHCAVLEPVKYAMHKLVQPECDRRTKDGKEDYQDFMDTVKPDDIVLTEADNDCINYMQLAIFNHGVSLDGECEQSGKYHSKEYNVDLRIRPDLMRDDLIIDVKTCEDARPLAVKRAIQNFDYDLSAALYLDVANHIAPNRFNHFEWVFVEKKPPYGVAVYRADDSLIEQGRLKYIKALDNYKYAVDNNNWFCYTKKTTMLYGG